VGCVFSGFPAGSTLVSFRKFRTPLPRWERVNFPSRKGIGVFPLSRWSQLKPQLTNAPDRKSGVVVLPVDPYQVHVYWIIEPAELRETELSLGEQTTGPSPVLRFYGIPHASHDMKESDAFLDVQIDLDAPNWYVYLPKPSKRYFVELGLRAEDGRFSVLARSTIIAAPPASPSENDDETLILVLGDYVFRDPPPGLHEDQPPNASPAPHLMETSGQGDCSGSNSVSQREPSAPSPTSSRPDNLCSEATTGPDQTGSGTLSEHHLVEMNERSFASGLSSTQFGDVSPDTWHRPTP
jgi:hypothetical protein